MSKAMLLSGMASAESLSLRHGIRVQPDPFIPVETVLLAVGDLVGHVNLVYASRMNKNVVGFFKAERFVNDLIESGVSLNGLPPGSLSQVFPRLFPVKHWRESSSALGNLQMVSDLCLGCKNLKLKHVVSEETSVHVFKVTFTNAGRVIES